MNFTGDQPPSGGPQTQFDGEGNPDPFPNQAMDLGLEGNKFPRQKGHDSLSEEESTLS